MDTPGKVETLRDKAFRLLAEQCAAWAKEKQEEAEQDQRLAKRSLQDAMKCVFGDDVEYQEVTRRGTSRPYASLVDFPEMLFREASWTEYGKLVATPVFEEPEGEEYEEWQDNPRNASFPRSEGIAYLSEVADLASRWASCDKTIYPWEPDAKLQAKAPDKPSRFAQLTIKEANAETRPFKVLGINGDDDVYIVAEYTDIETPAS